MSKKLLFKVNDTLVYPGQGVGRVTEISNMEVDNQIIQYYVVFLTEVDMTVLIPTEHAETRGLRSIVSKKEAETALEFLSAEPDAMPADWKMRYQMNMDLFKSGKILDVCSVIRTLYHRGKVKELPIQEKKLYENSYKIFQDEIVAVLKITAQEAEMRIHKALEPFPQNEKATQYDGDIDDDIFEDDEFDD